MAWLFLRLNSSSLMNGPGEMVDSTVTGFADDGLPLLVGWRDAVNPHGIGTVRSA
jgi:hypothetical protein